MPLKISNICDLQGHQVVIPVENGSFNDYFAVYDLPMMCQKWRVKTIEYDTKMESRAGYPPLCFYLYAVPHVMLQVVQKLCRDS